MKMPVTRTKARYRNSNVAEEQDNPLALALPERFEPEKFDVLLSESVELSTWDDLTDSQREDLAENIHQIRIATFEHYDLYCKLYRMMHKNYLARNPTMPEVIEWSYDIGDPLIKIEDTQLNQKNVVLPNTTSDAIFVSGFSGNGKSTMTERILFKCFPQILEHRHREFNEPQITYLKVDVPHDASRGGLLEAILTELDRVLKRSSIGSQNYVNYVEKNAKGHYQNLSSLENIVIQALNRHYVGIFVIDEFQSLLVARKDYRNTMLQLLDTFSNKLFVPTLKIGTPDSRELVSSKGRHTRRLGEPFFINPLSHDELDWEQAMAALFAFQPLEKPISRDEGIETLLKSLTAGVPDYLIKLWKGVIIEAMRSGSERITQKLIREVFRQQFPLLRSVINHINKGKAGRYSDLITAQQYFDASNQQNALKFLDKFAQATDVNGLAAQDVMKDIEDSVANVELSKAQQNKLKKIKTALALKAKQSNGPQTLENKD